MVVLELLFTAFLCITLFINISSSNSIFKSEKNSCFSFFNLVSLQAFGIRCETSPVKNELFPSIYLPHIPSKIITVVSDFSLFGNLIHYELPYMWFLFVRPEVCLPLPSDFTSRWIPLCSAMCFLLQRHTWDFHS